MSSKRSQRFFDLFDDRPERPHANTQFKRAGQQDAGLKKFHSQVQTRLDFHGQNISQALYTLQQHLLNHPESHVCLLIHGKGLSTGSKLKHALLSFLSSHPRCYAYLPAPSSMGAEGASLARFAKAR